MRPLTAWVVKLAVTFLLLSGAWVLLYRFVDPPVTATMIGDMLAGRGAGRQWLPITAIDRDMVRASIAAEDSKFCAHAGFDFEAIEDAAKRNAAGGRIRGGSTISQQAAKNVFLWQGGGYVRKALEAWFTFLIEQLWGKRRIMEVYLNVAETGIGTFGVSAGAQRYFGHDASAMSATEAARIAAVLPLPKKRSGVAPVGFTRRYGATVASRMGTTARDRLDGCVYAGATAPPDRSPKSPPKKIRPTPGSDYEARTSPSGREIKQPSARAPPLPVEAEPEQATLPPSAEPAEEVATPQEPSNGALDHGL